MCRGIRNCGSQFQLPRGERLTWASVWFCLYWLSSRLLACPAARVAPLGNRFSRLDQPRPDAPTGRSRARLFRLFPVLALLCGLHLLAAAPAAAQVTPPSVPQNVTVTPGDGRLTLTWQAPSSWGTWNASSFWIQWKFSASAATTWARVRATGVTNGFTDSVSATSVVIRGTQTDANSGDFSIANGTSYDLRIAAESKDPDEDGSDSSHYRYSSWVTVSATPGVPAAISPSALTVTPGATKLDLSWTAPANNGSAISGYDVHYTSALVGTVANDAAVQTVSAAAGWLAVSRSGTTASQSITSLTANTAYRVRVRAKNTHGNGAWVFSSGTTVVLAAPTGLTAMPCPICLDLSWMAPSGTVTGYDIHYTTAPTSGNGAVANGAAVQTGNIDEGWVAVGALNRAATDTSTSYRLAASTQLVTRVRVRAKSSSGVGAWAFVSGTANEQGPATNLDVAPGDGQLTLTWKAPAGDLGPYELEYTSASRTAVADGATATGNDAAVAWVRAGLQGEPAATAISYTITGLTNGRTYRVRLLAVNRYGAPHSTNRVFGVGTPGLVPTGLTLTPGDRELTARWTAPASVDVVRYEVQSKLMSAAQWPNTDTDVTGTSHTFTGLAAGETYQVRVRSVQREEGVSSAGRWTDPAQATLAPAAPTGLTVTPGNARLRVSWTAPSGTVTGYDVHYTSALVGSVADDAAISGNDPSAAWIDANHSGTDVMLTISGLTNSTEYRVRVRAENASVQKSAWTHGTGTPVPTTVSLSVSSASVTEGSPVTVTATLSATQTSATVIPLTLTSGTGTADDDYGTLASITIAANAESATGEITTAQDTDAEDETFTVALGTLPAGFGEGARASIEVTILDDDKPPLAPTGLVVTPGNEELALGWKQPADERAGVAAAVSGYDVHYTSAAVGTVADGDAASGNDASAAWVDTGHSGTDKMLTIANLTNGTEYRVRVRADNGKGKSEWLHGEGMPSGDSEEAAVLKLSLEALTGSIMGSAVSTVSERVESSDQPSQPLAGDADGSSSLWRMLSNLFGLPQPGVPSAGVDDAGHDRFQAHRTHRDEVISPAGRGPGAARYASGQLRLNSFSFSLDEPSDAGASGAGGALVLWGSADHRSFSGSDRGSFDDALSYSGSWTSLYLGMDQGIGEGGLAGLALSAGRGKVNYRYGAGDSESGRYDARLKAVYPYFSARVADGTRLWATVGFGRGDISNYRGTEAVPGTGDLRLGLAAAGVRHELSEWPMVRLSAVGDAAHARLKVVSSVRSLAGLQGKVNRLRAGLEVSGRQAAAPYLRVSARYERGEASRRKGLEAEGGFRWSGHRYSAEFHARTLRLRGDSTSVRESGAGASVYFRPQSDGTGASLSVSHDWGRPGGSGALWQDNPLSVSDSQSGSDQDSARSLNAELGYGLYSERLLGLVTPKLGWREDAAGERRLRIGAAYRANTWLSHKVGVEFGIHRRTMHRGVADYGGDLNASMSW